MPCPCTIIYYYTNHTIKVDFNRIYFAGHSEYIDAGAGAVSSKGEKLACHPEAQRGVTCQLMRSVYSILIQRLVLA